MKEYILTTAVILFFLIPRTFGQIDYSNLAHWAAHPDKTDMADISPNEDITDEQERAIADVFFIHPTTFIQKANRNIWNADINDELVNAQTDQKSIKNQASVFNGSARVFAPRYRQVHLKGFIREKSRKTKVALDLAYQDVAKAFEYYLEHWHKNRPLIIASHSQGTRHAERLIRDYIDGQDLSDQFVTAYLVGGYVPKNALVKYQFVLVQQRPNVSVHGAPMMNHMCPAGETK